jgi:pilus assembly protein Flp/PilA
MLQFVKTFAADDSGQDLVEYALVAMLVGVAAMSALRVLQNTVGGAFTGVNGALANAVPNTAGQGH